MLGALLAADAPEQTAPLWLWLATLGLAPVAIAFDIFVVARLHPRMGPVAAFVWTSIWFVAGLAFAIPVSMAAGEEYGIKYSTGFLVEKALTIDQVFVIALIIATWKTPVQTGRRLLFLALWIGLLVRLPFIALGYVLADNSALALKLVMSGFFVAGGIFLFRTRTEHPDPTRQVGVRILSRLRPVEPLFDGKHMTVTSHGVRAFTLAAVVFSSLLTADLYFDATVPLAFAFTKPPFIVLASSTFALFGVRSMYAFATSIHMNLVLLKVALAGALWLVAIDLLVSPYLGQPSWVVPLIVMVVVAAPMVYGLVSSRSGDHEVTRAQALHVGDESG